MNMDALETRVRSLDDRLRVIEDVQEIERLQTIYGDYLDYGMWEGFLDLFSDDTESIEIGDGGVYLGKTGVETMCNLIKTKRTPAEPTLQVTEHVIKIGQPVIDVDPGGKTAYGRWQAHEAVTRPVAGKWIQYWARGMYENEYAKEDGRWRFKKLHFYMMFLSLYENGWLKTPTKPFTTVHTIIKPDRPSTSDHRYPDPEWCNVPFHFKHPITGK